MLFCKTHTVQVSGDNMTYRENYRRKTSHFTFSMKPSRFCPALEAQSSVTVKGQEAVLVSLAIATLSVSSLSQAREIQLLTGR